MIKRSALPARFPRLPRQATLSDLRGAAQLVVQATIGVTDIVEGMHRSVWRAAGFSGKTLPSWPGSVSGAVFASVRGVTRAAGVGVDLALEEWFSRALPELRERPNRVKREAVLAALNGVFGDRLAEAGNPLATAMSLRHADRALDARTIAGLSGATGKVVVLIHGLCMNDLQWRLLGGEGGVDVGTTLSTALGYTPLYLRYNSGRHVSQNGRELSDMLEQLLANWPVPLCELTIIAHSMGGLVARSAVHSADGEAKRWPKKLKSMIFLGTPHHGAPLERAGGLVDAVLSRTSFTAPLARLRSAGITDLRYGALTDGDWHDARGRHQGVAPYRHVPLPDAVACYAVAATTAAKGGVLADRLIGDGLVPLHSALGVHREENRTLDFPRARQYVVHGVKHVDLLNHPEVVQKIVSWLARG